MSSHSRSSIPPDAFWAFLVNVIVHHGPKVTRLVILKETPALAPGSMWLL